MYAFMVYYIVIIIFCLQMMTPAYAVPAAPQPDPFGLPEDPRTATDVSYMDSYSRKNGDKHCVLGVILH
jgi:hypothetical protein